MKNSITNISLLNLQHFTAEEFESARRTIVSALGATRTSRSRNAAGRITYVAEPDWPVRLIAATKLVEFAAGKPVAMTISAAISPAQHRSADPEQHFSQILADPTMAASLKKQLDMMIDAAARNRPIEVKSAPLENNPGSSNRE